MPAPWLALGLTLCVVVDYLWIPYPLRAVPAPAWTDRVAEAPPGALLNIPGGYRARASEDMFLQTRHGRPLIGGYVSCTPAFVARRLKAYPMLRTLFEGRPRDEVDPREGLKKILDELPIGAVVIHLHRTREQLAALEAAHRGTPEARLYNPERGIPAAKLATIRDLLREFWGPPAYRDDEVEITWNPKALKT